MTLRNLFNMRSGSIFFYAFLPRCCCIVYYNDAPMALCKYDSRHSGVRCNKPTTFCTQCRPTGSSGVVFLLLWCVRYYGSFRTHCLQYTLIYCRLFLCILCSARTFTIWSYVPYINYMQHAIYLLQKPWLISHMLDVRRWMYRVPARILKEMRL